MKELCKATRFSKSKASKLATIGSSERLRTHEELLSAVHAWTLLYEIAILPEPQFEQLKSSFRDRYNAIDGLKPEAPPIITHGMITEIKRRGTTKSRLGVYAIIKFDEDAYRAELFDGDHIAELDEHLREIESSIPWLKIDRAGIKEISGQQYQHDFQAAMKTVTRAIYSKHIEYLLHQIFPRERGETLTRLCLRPTRRVVVVAPIAGS